MKAGSASPGGARGSIMAQALIMVMLLGMMASLALQVVLGRAVLVSQTAEVERSRFLAQAAESRVLECLSTTGVGATSCDASSSAGCFPSSIGGRAVRVSVSGSPPACSVRIEVADAP